MILLNEWITIIDEKKITPLTSAQAVSIARRSSVRRLSLYIRGVDDERCNLVNDDTRRL